jgi:hypothetical protein
VPCTHLVPSCISPWSTADYSTDSPPIGQKDSEAPPVLTTFTALGSLGLGMSFLPEKIKSLVGRNCTWPDGFSSNGCMWPLCALQRCFWKPVVLLTKGHIIKQKFSEIMKALIEFRQFYN